MSHLGSSSLLFRPLKYPLAMILNVTGRCNLACPHCILNSGKELPDEMEWQQWCDVIQQLIEHKVTAITISGGEPLLFDRLTEMIARIPSWMNVHILTNATLVNDDFARICAQRAISVSVSIDGGKSVHELIRGKGSFDAMIEGVGRFRQAGCKVAMNLTALKINFREIKAAAQVVHDMGLSRLGIILPRCSGRFIDNQDSLELTSEEMIEVADLVDQASQDIPTVRVNGREFTDYREALRAYQIYVPGTVPHQEDRGRRPLFICSPGINSFVINSDGTTSPCNGMPTLNCGSIKDNSIAEIWQNSPIFAELRRLRTVTVGELPAHQGCEFTDICGGGCRANAYNHFGRLDAPDPSTCWRHLRERRVFDADRND